MQPVVKLTDLKSLPCETARNSYAETECLDGKSKYGDNSFRNCRNEPAKAASTTLDADFQEAERQFVKNKAHKRQSSLYNNVISGIRFEFTKLREKHENKQQKRNLIESFPKYCESLEHPLDKMDIVQSTYNKMMQWFGKTPTNSNYEENKEFLKVFIHKHLDKIDDFSYEEEGKFYCDMMKNNMFSRVGMNPEDVESTPLNSANEIAEEIFTEMLDMLKVKATLECFSNSFEKNIYILSKMAAEKNMMDAMDRKEKLELYKNIYNYRYFAKEGFEREGSVKDDVGERLRFLFK